MTTERVIPLAQVMGNGYMDIKDNENDFSGAIVHPLDNNGTGSYMAPLDPSDLRAYATRVHEYAHLNLITSGEQPRGLHEAYEKAGIDNGVLQAIADAKVMHHCLQRRLSLKDLVVINSTDDHAKGMVGKASKSRQANLLLRAIGTDMLGFAQEAVTLTPKQIEGVKKTWSKVEGMRTLEDWIKVGLNYQRMFETPTKRRKREEMTKEILGTPPPESEASDTLGKGISDGTKARKSPSTAKRDEEKFKEIAKKLAEEIEEKEREEENAIGRDWESLRSGKSEPGRARMSGGSAVSSKKKEEEKDAVPLEVYEKERKEKSEIQKIVQELKEFKKSLDDQVINPEMTEKEEKKLAESLLREKARIPWGSLKIMLPLLEKNFEPKERSRRAKRAYVGAFRYPHRLVSDSAVFASKQRGKGGTLLIDCSGSMHIGYADIVNVLEQRPFATIALYASESYHDGGRGMDAGILLVVVDRGKRITEKSLSQIMRKDFGQGNVVDGPALDWLCKKAGEKFWICDGVVTGKDDCTTIYLQAEAALKTRRYHVKRWRSLASFLEGKSPNYG